MTKVASGRLLKPSSQPDHYFKFNIDVPSSEQIPNLALASTTRSSIVFILAIDHTWVAKHFPTNTSPLRQLQPLTFDWLESVQYYVLVPSHLRYFPGHCILLSATASHNSCFPVRWNFLRFISSISLEKEVENTVYDD